MGGCLSLRSIPGVSPHRLLLGVFLSFVALPSIGATITVDSAGDDTIADDDLCTLREALGNANADSDSTLGDCAAGSGPDVIEFSFAGPTLISIGSQLPEVTSQITIDATAAASCASANYEVVLQGPGDDTSRGIWLVAGSDGSVVRGLVIQAFGRGVADNGMGNRIQCNRLGTDATGTAASGNREGLVLADAVGSIVGTDGDGVDDAAEGNLISGNNRDGVRINRGSGSRLAGNFIGVDATGTAALPNAQWGIRLLESDGTIVGTNGDGQGDAGEGNLVSGNGEAGIKIEVNTLNTVIAGNLIGTDVTGTVSISNGGVASEAAGIFLNNLSSTTLIGTNGDGVSDELERNLISGNQSHGVLVRGSGNRISGNWIGVDVTGTVALGNRDGITISNGPADDNVVGTDGDGNGDAAEGNLIAGNTSAGVLVSARGAVAVARNRISGNTFGFAADGIGAIGGQPLSVLVESGTPDTLIGSDGNGTSDDLEPNRFGHTTQGVVVIQGGAAVDTVLRCNLFGLAADDTPAPLVNALYSDGGQLSLDRNLVYFSSAFGLDLVAGSVPSAQNNAVVCNASGAISDFATVLESTWWGQPDGPSGAGPGSGDSIGASIDAVPFLGAPPAACGLPARTYPCFPTDLAVSKSDGVTVAVPGESLTYSIVASNVGPNPDPAAQLADSFPAGLTCTYTSIAAGGASGNTAAGAGNLSETLSLPPGSSVTYTVSCSIDPAATGAISNTAVLADSVGDTDLGNNSATDADTVLEPQADLQITKSDGVTAVVAGESLIYAIAVQNAGPSDDPSAQFSDVLPAELSCTYTSVAANGASGNTAAGSGDLSEMLSLPAGSSVSYTVDCGVDPSATGSLSNTASVAASVTDPAPGNNSATDADTVLQPQADIEITKTVAGAQGQSLTYIVEVFNAGPSDDPAVQVVDVLPAALTCSYTSVPSGGASGNTATGSGDLADLLSLPAGAAVTYTLDCTIDPSFLGVLSNTATASASVQDPEPDNNSATAASEEGSLLAIPTLDRTALLVLIALLALVAARRLQRARRSPL